MLSALCPLCRTAGNRHRRKMEETVVLVRQPDGSGPAAGRFAVDIAHQSSSPRLDVASSSTQSSSSQTILFLPGTLRIGPARYFGQDFGP